MRKLIASLMSLGFGLVVVCAVTSAADKKKPETKKIEPAKVTLGRPVDFERDIYPILEANCISCHNVGIDESKFVAEDVASIMKGGKRGPAVVPKDPEKSLLYKVVSRSANPAMPPLPNNVEASALTPQQVGLIRQWILEGAAAGSGSSKNQVNWQPLPAGIKAIYSAALSSWGRFTAAGRANQITVYEVGTGETVTALKDPNLAAIKFNDKAMYPGGASHRDFVHSLAFSPDGNILASGGFRVVKLWQRPSNIRKFQFTTGAAISAIAVNANGQWLAAGTPDNGIQLWNLKDGKPGKKLMGHTAGITGLHFSPTAEEKFVADKQVTTANAAVKAAQNRLETAKKAIVDFDPSKPKKLDAEQAKVAKEKLVAAQTAAQKAVAAAIVAAKAVADANTAFNKKVAESTKLISGSLDKTVRIWTLIDGKQIQLINTPAPVNDVTANKDATLIVSANADNFIRGWASPAPVVAKKPAVDKKAAKAKKTEPPKPKVEIKGHTKSVTSIALIQPAGTQIVSGSEDGTVRIWNLSNGGQVRSINLGAPVTGVAARSDGTAIAATAANNIARLWDMNGKQLAEMKGDLSTQRTVVSVTENQTVTKQKVAIADAAIKAAEKNSKDRGEAVKKATEAKTAAEKAFAESKKKTDDANKAAATAKQELAKKPKDAALKKKSTTADQAAAKQKDELKKAMDTQKSATRSLQLAEKAVKTAQGLLAKTKTEKTAIDNLQKQVDANLKKVQDLAKATEKPIRAIAFSPNGKKLITGGDDNVVHVWNGKNGSSLEMFTGHQGAVSTLVYAPNGLIISGSADKNAIVWNANPAWKLIGQLGPKKDAPLDVSTSPFVSRILALDFSKDGKFLATGGGDPSRSGELMIWDIQKQTMIREFKDAHSDTVFGVEFSRDGKQLLSGAADKFVKIHDVATGKHIKSFEGHTHHVLDVSWKADGSSVASAGADNAIKVWNVETGEQRRTIAGYAKQVTSLRFIGVGENIISCGGDKTVRFHKTSNGQNYRSFTGGTDYMYAATSTRDEKLVVAGGEDGVLRVWNGTNGQSIANFEPPKTDENDPQSGSNKQASK